MIFHCAEELEVGRVYIPASITVKSVLMPAQPIYIVRTATAEEYVAQSPEEALKPLLYPGGHYYEVTTD